MASDDLTHQLCRLGLAEPAALVYRHLLTGGPASPDELAARNGLGPGEVRERLSELVADGLVGTADDDRYAPLPPEQGLRILAARREAELNEATVAARNAYREYRRSRRAPVTEHIVEVVTGPAIMERIAQAERNVRYMIRRLDSPPHYTQDVANETELRHLANGIQYRVVYAQASLGRPGYFLGNIEPCMAAGEQARVLPEVPVKLTIVDDTMALVGLPIGEADVNNSLLIVRPSSLFSALTGLFELSWRAALPMRAGGAAAPRLEPVEQRLLTLLAAGLTDDAITRKLGVSRRTFFRYLERLQAQAGASSRFQLGMHAVRDGWLRDG